MRSADTRKSVFNDSATLSIDQFHPEILFVSKQLLQDGHYAQSIEEAFKRVIKEVKSIIMVKSGENLDGDKAMNRTFGSETQEPLVRFNKLETDGDRDEQKGMMFLFKGIVGIRNRKVHDNILLSDPQRAIEYLSLASLLMRLLDEFGLNRNEKD